MISSESLKKSEVSEDLDYNEFLDEFPDDENIDNLGFSDEPLEEAENTYMTMKDVDDLDKQVVDRYSQRAKKDIAPLQSLGQNITETADLNASAYEMLSEKLDDIQEEKEKALAFISKFKGFDEDTIKEITKKQIKIFEDEIGKIFEKNYVDALEIQKNIISNAVEKVIEDKIMEAEKRLDAKLEACRLAEEKLDKKEEEFNRKQEEIQQKIDEILALQDVKKEEVEEMINSLTAQNAAAQEVIASERKKSLQLKNLIDEQKNIIITKDEQIEKVLIDNREKEKQISQILAQNEQIIEENKKKDDRRREEIREQNEEIKELRQVMIGREEKMERNNSILTILFALIFIFWAVAGFFTLSELVGLLNTLIKVFSWSSFFAGFGIIIFKFYKGLWK